MQMWKYWLHNFLTGSEIIFVTTQADENMLRKITIIA